MEYFALSSMLSIILTMIAIGFAWWGLQSVRFDIFLKKPDGPQAKGLQIILSIALGYQFAQFFLDYLGWSIQLRNLF